MKKWTAPVVTELKISATANEWKIQPSLDGGYLGDGKITGWFGESDGNNNNDNTDKVS